MSVFEFIHDTPPPNKYENCCLKHHPWEGTLLVRKCCILEAANLPAKFLIFSRYCDTMDHDNYVGII